MSYTQFLWGILSLIILSNGMCSIAQQQNEEDYYDDEYEEYEEYDYEGCSKYFVVREVWKLH